MEEPHRGAHAGYALIGYPAVGADGNTSYPLYECLECGAATAAPASHDRWHAMTTPRPGAEIHPKEGSG